jgi:hypothetical protein
MGFIAKFGIGTDGKESMPTTVTSRGDLKKGNFIYVERVSDEALAAQKAAH